VRKTDRTNSELANFRTKPSRGAFESRNAVARSRDSASACGTPIERERLIVDRRAVQGTEEDDGQNG
jgi:hypothetical protein